MQGLSIGMALVACGNYSQSGILDLRPLMEEMERLEARMHFVCRDGTTLDAPDEWFVRLRELRFEELWLAVDPCPRDLETVIRYGIGAAPAWAVYTFGVEGTLLWQASERLAGDQLVVELSEWPDNGITWDTDEDPEVVLSELQDALVDAQMLAEERGEEEYSDRFRRALSVLEAVQVPSVALFPEGYGSDGQRRLLEAATLSYVFGRGGWCEWEGTPTAERRELSRAALNLYVASVNAIQSAING